ncbi:Protein transport protein Sec61 subunit alpha [Hibiscus syriacus]|uniref:Protein transport protein Sec61 subunit alpha n=1 Tax=Hibiscus syriacus TaxID=106335 RepID=A0A6A3AJ95_HIBSY|nr:Protein transport protein Sec61 subunit alpha [Hibiscus syriacus]
MLAFRLVLASIFFACCLSSAVFGAKLPDNEVQYLKDIGKTLGKKDWNFSVDPCSGEEGWATPNALKAFENAVTCNCSFPNGNDTVCHVVSFKTRPYSALYADLVPCGFKGKAGAYVEIFLRCRIAQLSAIVYYDGEIREDETGVIFVSNERVKISFKRNITLEELITKISRKVHVGSSRRMSSLQYRFPTSLLPLTYTTFELSNNDDVEMMVDSQSNYSDGDIEKYAKFVQVRTVRGQSLNSHYGLAEQVDQVDSPTTVMCNDFNAIMGNPHHGTVTSTLMGRHSFAIPYDMYRDRGAGIKVTMESLGPMWQPPFVQHKYCFRHIVANYHRRYKKNDERQLIVRMNLRAKNEEGYDYISLIDKEMWTNAYDGGYQYGHMRTNLAEAINSTLKGAQNHTPKFSSPYAGFRLRSRRRPNSDRRFKITIVQSLDVFVSSIAGKILNSPSIVAPFTTPPAPSCSLCRCKSAGVNLVRCRRRRMRRWSSERFDRVEIELYAI